MSKRQTHNPEFKALAESFRLRYVAMEAFSGRMLLQRIAADHGVHPILASQ
jgi:hypothetical protein